MLVGACGGGDNSGADGGDATTGGDVATDTSTSDTAANDTGTNDTGANDTGTAGSCADAGFQCRQCCAGLYPDAAAFLLANEETCACMTPGDCQTECDANLCQGKAPNNQCNGCLRNAEAGACAANGLAACVMDLQCAPLAQCEQGCVMTGSFDGGGPG